MLIIVKRIEALQTNGFTKEKSLVGFLLKTYDVQLYRVSWVPWDLTFQKLSIVLYFYRQQFVSKNVFYIFYFQMEMGAAHL